MYAKTKTINTSSTDGKVYTLFGAWYHAPKHALEEFSDSLKIKTKPFGIDVIIIEIGATNSEWADIVLHLFRACPREIRKYDI
ncbi:SDR family NAD(P)-dependent oxidoreductase [Amphibacillus marinus]|uniref:SDR family NAD(P)-dependent oxidoreductase n=1 Tax=Amphibacillus marinus TaxID=872970 RepID=UPI000B8226B9